MDPLIPTSAPAPDFTLPDLTGRRHASVDQRGKILVLNFWSAECPWAERLDPLLMSWLPSWDGQVVVWWIAPNAHETPELLLEVAARRGLPLVLRDSTARVADLYGAQTTPHLFVLDGDGRLRYQGAADDVTFRQRTPTRQYVYEAIQALLAGQPPDPAVTPAYGCAIVRPAPQA